MRRILIAAGVVVAVASVGTASASFVITDVGQIAPTVRARLAGINATLAYKSKEKFVCSDGSCKAAAVAYAYCPSGTWVTGGGFYEDANATFISTVAGSSPVHTSKGFGWGVLLADVGKTNGGFFATVVCGAHRRSAAADARLGDQTPLERAAASLSRQLRR